MAEKKLEKATFGAGCFWGVEDVFMKTKGVKKTAVGFMGGTVKKPSYEDVCTGVTGHAEVVYVEYDPSEVNYEQLLDVFWKCHDPTQLNRQGPDIGLQYRSIIFYHNEKQKKSANDSKKRLAQLKVFKGKIATSIEPAKKFFKAEEYHQKYFRKHPFVNVCHTFR